MRAASNIGQGGGQPMGAPVVVNVTPTTGQTVSFNNSVLDQLMVVSP